MFFNEKGSGIEAVPLGNHMFRSLKQQSNILDLTLDQLKSFLPTELTLEQLEEKYGVEAQNKALEEVRNLKENSHIRFIKKYIEDLDIQNVKKETTVDKVIDKEER